MLQAKHKALEKEIKDAVENILLLQKQDSKRNERSSSPLVIGGEDQSREETKEPLSDGEDPDSRLEVAARGDSRKGAKGLTKKPKP